MASNDIQTPQRTCNTCAFWCRQTYSTVSGECSARSSASFGQITAATGGCPVHLQKPGAAALRQDLSDGPLISPDLQPLPVEACGNCRFSRLREVAPSRLRCCRHAPRVVDSGAWDWPLTQRTDWCGEYEPNSPPPEPVAPVVVTDEPGPRDDFMREVVDILPAASPRNIKVELSCRHSAVFRSDGRPPRLGEKLLCAACRSNAQSDRK